jgi:Deoxyribonuclease II
VARKPVKSAAAALRKWWCRLTPAAFAFAALLAVPAFGAEAPMPLLAKDTKVEWWFAYKFNSQKYKNDKPFGGCGPDSGTRVCLFDKKGTTVNKGVGANFSQQYAFASSADGRLEKGKGCLGMTLADPVGATFDQIYHGSPFYVIWNDQFYDDPVIKGCAKGQCGAPWGHSKGVLAWNEAGEGVVMQVTTPSWPASGSEKFPRKHRNTLGCVNTQNNLNNAQHFFALKLDKKGVMTVLEALANSNVVTNVHEPQIARIGGPDDVRALAEKLGEPPRALKPDKKTAADLKIMQVALTNDVTLISKPSNLNVPPWQMVSALLESESERTATWWAFPQIFSTKKSTAIGCWEGELKSQNKKPGDVVIALDGSFGGHKIKLIGGSNHAKIGVTTSGSKHYAIFGDLNQQGSINAVKGRCDKSQNGRGGMFFVVQNEELFKTLSDMLEGEDEPFKAK